ncbi:MAG: gliding motility-associated C-terminal domain-containing protein [Bacteroidota bacterium]
MKFSLPNAFLLFVLIALPKALISQCGTGPCPPGQPQWSQDPAAACIAINEFELDCASGSMPANGSASVIPPVWCTTVENNIFYLFTASSSSASFEVSAFNCSGGNDALQAAVLDCNLNLVSACNGNIPNGTSAVIVGTGMTPGETYMLMIDGSAGSECDYIINGALPTNPVGNNICVGGPSGNNIGTYTANQDGIWSIQPPTAGIITSPNPGSSATVEWLFPGMWEVCISACPNGMTSCLNVEIGENIVIEEGPTTVCLNDQAMCGNTPFIASIPGEFDIVDIQPNGICEQVTTCTYIVPEQIIIFEDAAVCVDEFYDVCGVPYYDTGVWMEDCPGPSGCDDLLTVNLVVQDPTVIIDEPIEVGCGSNWMAIINGTGSPNWVDPFVEETTIEWTGPGPIPNPSEILIEVTVPGEYCLTITHTSYGVTCTDTECVTVEQTLSLPDPPDLDGPISVCGGMETYTVSPVGNSIPDSYTWTTPNGEPYTTQGNFSITVDWANSNGGLLCVTANNLCGPSDPTCIDVTVGTGPDNPIVNGPDEACDGDVLTYEITNPFAGATCTWTVPPGASFNQSGNTISVDFTGASDGDVCVTCMDNCGESDPTCIAVVVNTPPDAPVFTSGPNQVCATDMETYCVNDDPEANSWSWTSPAGNFPNSPDNCLDIDWTGLNGGNICVTANNECGASPQTCFNVDIIDSPTAAISGEGEFCTGSNDVIDLTIELTGTAPWTITYSNGGPDIVISDIQASPYILSVSEPGTYTLSVVTDGGICAGTVSGSAEVIENDLPTATLTGSGDICLGTGEQVDLTIELTGAAPWTVVYEDGNGDQSNLTINASPFTLPISENNAGNITLISVSDDNDCDGTVDGSTFINVLDAPTTTVSTECNATNTEYVVTINIMNGDPDSYSVTPNTGTLVAGVFTSNPIPSGSGYSFVINDDNDCNPVTVEDPIVVCDCTTQVGVMDNETLRECGDGPITAFVYDNTNEVLDGDDVQMYVLHSGNSASITDPVFSVTPDATASFVPPMVYGTTYYLSAVVGNGGGLQGIDLNDPCLQVAQGTPVIFYEIPTATIAGSTEICIGETADLTIELTGVSPWTVTINGVPVPNIFSSPFTYTVEPTADSAFVLTMVEDANCSNAASGTESVTVNTSPEIVNLTETCNGSGTAYTVSFEIVGGDPSCYMVAPMDGTLTGNVFTSNEIADGLGYEFTVTDCRGCPAAVAQKDLVDCNCLSTAGDLTADALDVCGDETVPLTYDNTDEFLDADDALCFILYEGNPQAPIMTNSTPDFSFDPALLTIGTQYTICPVVGNDDGSGCVDLNDPCLSTGVCTQVTFREIPTAFLTQGSDICNGEIGTLTVEFTGAGPWEFEYRDADGNINMLEATNSPFVIDVSPTATIDYDLVSLEGRFCTGTVDGMATVTVNQAPEVNLLNVECDATSTEYVVTFEIIGGDAITYDVVPGNGSLDGNIFTSNPYPDGDFYSFEIDDQFQCGPALLQGGFICECITDAGAMPLGLLEYCIGATIEGELTVGDTLDGDDILIYVLHTNSGILTVNDTSDIIAISDVPTFDFDPATMSTNVTYYLSAVAGNQIGAGGNQVDFEDFCLSATPGTPVIFYDLPEASISGSTTICNGESAEIFVNLVGQGPFVLNYAVDGDTTTSNPITTPGSHTLDDISPANPVSYTLISIEDQGTGCSNSAVDTVVIMVNQPVEAGAPYDEFEICDNTPSTLSLFENLVGFEYGGEWTDDNGNIFPNGALNTATLPVGSQTYTYTIFGEAPCPDDMAQVEVIIHPAPVADAGEDVEFGCDLDPIQIGGPNTSTGVSYSWEGDVSNPNIATPDIVGAGDFVLTVTTQNNCVDMDTVSAFISNEQPVPVIDSTNITCFGLSNGTIQVIDVSGGEAPYTYSLNNGSFSSNNFFINLGEGSYTVVVMDNNGCESAPIQITIEEPEEVTVELVPSVDGTPPMADFMEEFRIDVESSPVFEELDSVLWTASGGYSDSTFCNTCPYNDVSLNYQTTFNITVAEGDCEDDDQLTVFVSRDHWLYAPNAFSPNQLDAEENELFKLYASENIVKIRSFQIFNRWGEQVHGFFNFEINNNEGWWDGTHRNEMMNPAVFVWTAEVEFEDDVIRFYKGDVALLR